MCLDIDPVVQRRHDILVFVLMAFSKEIENATIAIYAKVKEKGVMPLYVDLVLNLVKLTSGVSAMKADVNGLLRNA